MQISNAANAPDLFARFPTTRSGKLVSRVVLEGIESAPDNYQLLYGEGQEGGWTTPRHHHNFEQVRWVIDGDYSITDTKVLPAGAVAYFPESGYYGPQVKGASMKMLTVQFGGPSGNGFISIDQRGRAREELRAGPGSFEGGKYHYVDEQGMARATDSSQAEWERATGRTLDYPPARYDEVIAMNPDSFSWIDDPQRPGVRTKRLGSFTERDVRIAFIRLSGDSEYLLGAEPASEIIYVKSGELVHGDDKYGPMWAFGTAADEAPQTLRAGQDTELFYVKLPTFT